MIAKLKPCPFCGGKIYRYFSSEDMAFIFYHNVLKNGSCPMLRMMILADSLADADKKWNERKESNSDGANGEV